MGAEGVLRLARGKDLSIRRGHPWVFAGAVDSVEGDPISGDVVEVVDHRGHFVAWAFFSASSQILARCVSRRKEAFPDEAFLVERLSGAWDWRRRLGFRPEGGVRVVNAEGDGLPGLVIDVYAGVAAVQLHHPWTERYRELIQSFAVGELGCAVVVDRSQRALRLREGLGQCQGVVVGVYEDDPVIEEGNARFAVDVRHGQKTGFYLDQRANRRLVASWAKGRRVLDLCAYTGGFGIHALVQGASHVTFVESGSTAVDRLQENLDLNGLETHRFTVVRADVGEYLASQTESFDLVVLDPPPLARRRHEAPSAWKHMVSLVQGVVRAVGEGGIVVLFSCSHSLGQAELWGALARAGVEQGRFVRVAAELGADVDHPTAAAHPEGVYLRGVVALLDAGGGPEPHVPVPEDEGDQGERPEPPVMPGHEHDTE